MRKKRRKSEEGRKEGRKEGRGEGEIGRGGDKTLTNIVSQKREAGRTKLYPSPDARSMNSSRNSRADDPGLS